MADYRIKKKNKSVLKQEILKIIVEKEAIKEQIYEEIERKFPGEYSKTRVSNYLYQLESGLFLRKEKNNDGINEFKVSHLGREYINND